LGDFFAKSCDHFASKNRDAIAQKRGLTIAKIKILDLLVKVQYVKFSINTMITIDTQ
jgi:hypothetical protein